MEGAGIADASWLDEAGYLVIRGTCDYCNNEKRDTWQLYAAIVAAAYARSVIEHMPMDLHSVSKAGIQGENESKTLRSVLNGTGSTTTSLEPFSKEAVRRAACALMNQNGSTTTLDVKHRLRRDGFFAEQQQVSNAMKDVASAYGWTSRVKDDHLVYTVPPELEPPSIGSSFEPFYSIGPGDTAEWALVFRILNSGNRDLTIRRAVYFLDPAKRIPICQTRSGHTSTPEDSR